MKHQRRVSLLLVVVAAAIWAGLLVGVSFIATPVKFLAPSLTLSVALDVGRQTFSVYSRIEVGCAIMLALLIFVGARSAVGLLLVAILASLVAIQIGWLLPTLDARVTAITANQPLAPSSLHQLYVLLEATKVVSLMALILAYGRSLIRSF